MQLVTLATIFLALAAAAASLSPPSLAAIAKVKAAYAEVEARQAALPPAKDDRERLERMYDPDQVGRVAFREVDWATVPDSERKLARTQAFDIITAHDLADQKALKNMLPPEGWFLRSKYGAQAALTAFLIVQHAVNDPELMKTTLGRMEPLVAKGEVRGPDYALLFDRVALEFDHKPQRYGSQIGCIDGRPEPRDLEYPANVDVRRKAIGFKDTEAEYMQNFKNMYCGPGK